MTRAETQVELERVIGALVADDLNQNAARFDHWQLGKLLSFRERRQLEQRRDEYLWILAQSEAAMAQFQEYPGSSSRSILGADFIDLVCTAMGIDAATVQRVTITAVVGEIVRVQVDHVGKSELLNLEVFKPKDGNG